MTAALILRPHHTALVAAGHPWVGVPGLDLTCPTCGGGWNLKCGRCGASASLPCGTTCDDHQPRRWCPNPNCAEGKASLPDCPSMLLLADTTGNVWGTLHDTEVLDIASLVNGPPIDDDSPVVGVWGISGHAIHVGRYEASVETAHAGRLGPNDLMADLIDSVDRHRRRIPFVVPGLPDQPCITTIDLGDAE